MTGDFELISEITQIEMIAVNLSIRERARLKEQFGGKRWRKMKGIGLFVFRPATSIGPSFTGTRRTGSVVGE